MNKIYVSLPMKGQEDTIEERCKRIQEYADINYPGIELVFPNNITQFFGDNKRFERDHPYGWYIGEDIKLMFDCDTILMTKGWEQSLGCNIELDVAKRIGMTIIHPFKEDGI